jgi:type I restriction enzyme S subunit
MRDGWRQTTLGEIAVINPEATHGFGADRIIRYVDLASVTPGHGIAAGDIVSVRYADAAGRARRVIRSGDVLVATVRPYLRGFGRVPPSLDGEVASTGFTVLRDTGYVVPGFVWLVVGTDRFVDHLMERATGTNYPAVRAADVASFPVSLPTRAEQQRIVHLFDGTHAAALAASAVEAATSQALALTLDELTAPRSRALGDLVSMGSGPSWKSEQETTQNDVGARPVIGISNTRADGRLEVAERRWVRGLPASVSTLLASSLVMIRTNGNRARIGNVYRLIPEAVGSAFSAFQIGLHPEDPADTPYLYWYLRSPRAQSRISEAASGTTGLGNIAVRWLRGLDIPWPSLTERAAFVESAEALDLVRERAADQSRALRDLRSALLAEILFGDHTIPDSYDALLEKVS